MDAEEKEEEEEEAGEEHVLMRPAALGPTLRRAATARTDRSMMCVARTAKSGNSLLGGIYKTDAAKVPSSSSHQPPKIHDSKGQLSAADRSLDLPFAIEHSGIEKKQ